MESSDQALSDMPEGFDIPFMRFFPDVDPEEPVNLFQNILDLYGGQEQEDQPVYLPSQPSLYPQSAPTHVPVHANYYVRRPRYTSTRSRMNQRRLDEGLPTLEADPKKRRQKRPASSGPREIESINVLCDGKVSGMGCYFPYALPVGDRFGNERIRWNSVSFNPANGVEDAEFASLDPVDKVVLHLGRARTRIAAAAGIWRKAKNRPFKPVSADLLYEAVETFINEMEANLPPSEDEPLLHTVTARISFHSVADRIGVYSAQTEGNKSILERVFLPRVNNWHSELARTDPEWAADLQQDLDDALAQGFHYVVGDDGQSPRAGSPATAWLWRNAKAVERDGAQGPGSKRFRTMYTQAWSYVNLGLLHLYEAVRLLMVRGQELARAGPDSEDSRLRRLALLPADFRLLLHFAFLAPTFMGIDVLAERPSWHFANSNAMVDSIEADLKLDLKWVPPDLKEAREISDWKELPIFLVGEEDRSAEPRVLSRPAVAVLVLMCYVLALPKDKERTVERERLWELGNDQLNWQFVGAYIESALRRGVLSDRAQLARQLLFDVFDPQNRELFQRVKAGLNINPREDAPPRIFPGESEFIP